MHGQGFFVRISLYFGNVIVAREPHGKTDFSQIHLWRQRRDIF